MSDSTPDPIPDFDPLTHTSHCAQARTLLDTLEDGVVKDSLMASVDEIEAFQPSRFLRLDDYAMSAILVRTPLHTHCKLCQVCRKFYSIIKDPSFFTKRLETLWVEYCIIVATGFDNYSSWGTLMRYHSHFNPCNNMIEKRYNASSVVFDNTFWVLGGETYRNNVLYIINSVECFDVRKNSWTPKTPMPTKRSGFCCEVINNTIIVIGGKDENSTDIHRVELYNVRNDNWTVLADLPYPTWKACSLVFDNQLGIFGGVIEHHDLLSQQHAPQGLDQNRFSVQVYFQYDNVWKTKIFEFPPRWSYASIVYEGMFYIIGGIYKHYTDLMDPTKAVFKQTNSVIIIDIKTGFWKYGVPLPFPRAEFSAVLYQNSIVVFGGIHPFDRNDMKLDKFYKNIPGEGHFSTTQCEPLEFIFGDDQLEGTWRKLIVVESNDIDDWNPYASSVTGVVPLG